MFLIGSSILKILSVHIFQILVLLNQNHKRTFLRLSLSRIGLYSVDYPFQTSVLFLKQL